ncbi:putative cysteine--tRNA ligase, mitochondrial isoform X3 [Camelus bactrianus]|uniref:Cysteine--tRNA ligase, mitochondrial isoform X3 n=1 Tax=Camelus bactrianus TaxID=9837 RepID=A0AC58RJE0_CAMBA
MLLTRGAGSRSSLLRAALGLGPRPGPGPGTGRAASGAPGQGWLQPAGYDTGVKVYNSLTRRKDPLIVSNVDAVSWYSCGPTVYDHAHLGHACSYVRFDIIRRILSRVFGCNIIMVMGVTDVDDKIIKRANEMNVSPASLANLYEEDFKQDMAALKVLPPTVYLRVTDNIPQIIAFIEGVIARGHAYCTAKGNVYFDLQSRGDKYGRLVGVAPGPVGEPAVDSDKRHPSDFALWKAVKPQEPAWASPWGNGRPGWHIECSTICRAAASQPGPVVLQVLRGQSCTGWCRLGPDSCSVRFCGTRGFSGTGHVAGEQKCHRPRCVTLDSVTLLFILVFGSHLDIHSGGIDLAFPHHENEIAQCEAFHQCRQWGNYFLHAGHLHVKGKEKMSKSLKNYITIKDFLRAASPDVFRLFCLRSGYRSAVDYGDGALLEAQRLLHAVAAFAEDARAYMRGQLAGGPVQEDALWESLGRTKGAVQEALADDFNTPGAVDAVMGLVHHGNRQLKAASEEPGGPRSPAVFGAIVSYVEQFFETVGVSLVDRQCAAGAGGPAVLHSVVEELVRFRLKVRQFALATGEASGEAQRQQLLERRPLLEACDALRRDLAAHGVSIKDRSSTSTWELLDPRTEDPKPGS